MPTLADQRKNGRFDKLTTIPLFAQECADRIGDRGRTDHLSARVEHEKPDQNVLQ